MPSEVLQRRPDIRRSERTARGRDCGDRRRDARLVSALLRHRVRGAAERRGIDHLRLGKPRRLDRPEHHLAVFDAGKHPRHHRSADRAAGGAALRLSFRRAAGIPGGRGRVGRLRAGADPRDDLATATAANQRAADLAVRLYVQGLTDFLSVLQAQFNLFTSEDALAQSRRRSRSTSSRSTRRSAVGGRSPAHRRHSHRTRRVRCDPPNRSSGKVAPEHRLSCCGCRL